MRTHGSSTEQQRALAHVQALARPHRFRVARDLEGFPMIPGRYGRVEWFDGRECAVYSDRPRLFERLWAIPGVRRHQTGDREMRAVFPPEALEQVAAVIRAKRKRQGSPEAAAMMRARALAGATSRPQDRTEVRTKA